MFDIFGGVLLVSTEVPTYQCHVGYNSLYFSVHF